jgi:hypothetical protein
MPLKMISQPTKTDTPIPAAAGLIIAKNPTTIINTAKPIDHPAALLKESVVLSSFIFFSPLFLFLSPYRR